MARAIIFDIDGTLSDPSHRLHHVRGERRDWAAFFAGLGDDLCHEPIAELASIVNGAVQVVLCTGRPEEHRRATEKWLARHSIRYAGLYMRPTGDTRPDYEVKARILRAIREDGYDPFLVVDDRPSVVAMWREQGLTCLQCRDWDESLPVAPGMLTLMVGPSGAGKTTWLRGLFAESRSAHVSDFGIKTRHIVSSDAIREDLCGDFRNQDRNEEVFAALHGVVKTRLRHGLPAVVDATNLRRKDRLSIVDLAPPGGAVRYIVIDRPIAEKRRDAGWRGEIVGKDGQPVDLIGKHDQTFRSQLSDILSGDRLPNIEVIDLRRVG